MSRSDYDSSGLGATFSNSVLTITDLAVGRPLIVSYFINNPADSTAMPSYYDGTGFGSTLNFNSVSNSTERLVSGTSVRLVTNSVATLKFMNVSDNCDFLFSAYQVNC